MRFAPAALRLFRRNNPVVREPEPADMGTAFGMEASLGDASEYEDYRRSDYGLESQTQPAAAQESPLSWLTGRRS